MTITILGDICPAWGFPKEKRDADTVFNDLLPVIRESDYCVANLEAPATAHTSKLNKNSVCLRAEPEDLAILKDARISAVALANNHILDFEEQGLRDTLETAEKLGIGTYGAGTIQKASEPYIVEIEGKKIGFLAFAEQEFNCAEEDRIGANRWDDLESPTAIAEAKRKCDYLFIQYHGGIEHYIYPSPWLQKRCRKMADSGADFVVCQHSHCIGTYEKRNGCGVLYGQGNCIFGCRKNNTSWNRGLIVKLHITDEIKVEFIPIEATENGEQLCDAQVSKEVLESLEKESLHLSDKAFIEKAWSDFCEKQKNEYLPMLFSWNRYFNKLNRIIDGKLINLFTARSARQTAMNLIRCVSHREVITTILENEYRS